MLAFGSPCCSVHKSSTCHSLLRELEVLHLFLSWFYLLLEKVPFIVFTFVQLVILITISCFLYLSYYFACGYCSVWFVMLSLLFILFFVYWKQPVGVRSVYSLPFPLCGTILDMLLFCLRNLIHNSWCSKIFLLKFGQIYVCWGSSLRLSGCSAEERDFADCNLFGFEA